MSASNAKASEGHGKPAHELVLERIFDAPRDLVFKVWTDPAHVAQWWGPHGFKTTIHAMDVRPGGRWHYTMRGPDGDDYPFDGVYAEIVEPERLVFDGAIHADTSQRVWTEVTFTEQDAKTKVTVRQVLWIESAASRGASIGWNQQLDRLTAYLAKH